MDKKELRIAMSKISTGDIADAMVMVGLTPRTIIGLHAVKPDQEPTAGYAFTIQQMVRSVGRTEESLTKHRVAIDTMMKEGDVLVVDVGGRMDVCTGGGLLALRAKNLGVQGFVINGCMRDIDDIAKDGCPTYLKGGCPIKSSPLLETTGINVPVQIGDTQVCPGDLIVMDPTGILVVPADRAEEVYEMALRIQKREDGRMEYVRAGGTVEDALAHTKL